MASYLDISNKELARRIGSPAQISYAKKMEFSEGPAKSLEFVEVSTGSGLFCHVLSDRGLGIGHASVRGVPVCWISPNEEVSSAYYNRKGDGWLETFGGGMITSCGMTNVGGATVVEGIEVGLHGRLSHLPARNVNITTERSEEDYKINVEGDLVDCRVMGPTFLVHRKYTFSQKLTQIRLHDQITNIGDTDQPLFILYHLNVGYPFLSENSQLSINDRIGEIKVKDDSYKNETSLWNVFDSPKDKITERVFYHTLEKKEELSEIVLSNEYDDCKLKFKVQFPLNEINHLVEWKMLGPGNYILGIEPGNTFASGRDYSFKNKDVEYLKAGETKNIHLILSYDVVWK